MFTVCYALFASLTAVTPLESECFKMNQADVNVAVVDCRKLDHDPFTTCESQRVGALKYFFRVRKLDGV